MRVTILACGLLMAAASACKEPDFSKRPGAPGTAPTTAADPAKAPPSAPAVAAPTPPAPPMPAPPKFAPLPTPPPAKQPPPFSAPGTKIGDKIAKFEGELVDLGGKKPKRSKLDSQAKGPITVYTIVGTTCPATKAYTERAKALEISYRPRGVRFVYLYPNVDETNERKQAFHKDRYEGLFVDDVGSKIARALGSVRTSESIVADADQKIRYRGPIDDSRAPAGVKQRYLADALDALLKGQTPPTTYATVFA